MVGVTSDAEQRVRNALRVVKLHETRRCEQCTEDGCLALAAARGLTKPGEW
ncbi:hypothetical protein BDK92_3371 [Micromonospora pisi]|uniref:4Fe-4S domain-containing protein n=1 Tax=Micromonospora pisi TaxID=589240 RepID=A0A495JL09_9ACTN|nr:hypothetical protein BDK92_3371 [Micromonospora pisi]